MQVIAEAVDFTLRANNELEQAVTRGGPAQLTTASIASGAKTATPSQTVITADKFTAIFAGHNALKSLTGGPNAKTLTSTCGRPDPALPQAVNCLQNSIQHAIAISAKPHRRVISDIKEGVLEAWAAKGQYNAEDESFLLTGNPRVEDDGNGLAMTADNIRMDRKTGDAHADGNVKSTYRTVVSRRPIAAHCWGMTKSRYTLRHRRWLIRGPLMLLNILAARAALAGHHTDPRADH